MGVALLLARRNLHLGRGDRKTALRCALYTGSLYLVAGMLGSHHVPLSEEADVIIENLATAALVLGVIATWYLAIEPYVRKAWPHLLRPRDV